MNFLAIEFRLPNGTKCTPGRCMSCGCTHEQPCPEGCAWIDTNALLCSACLFTALKYLDRRVPTQVINSHDNGEDFVAVVVRMKKLKPAKRRRRTG